MFLAWEANLNQRSSSVWIDRSKEYDTPSDPWSRVHDTNEGIVQSMVIEGAPWDDYHHRSLLPDCEENTPDDLYHPSVFDFLSNTVNTVDSERNLSNIESLMKVSLMYAPDYQKDFNLYLVAADTTIATVLVQEDNGIEHPIYSLSINLNDMEVKYSYIEKLALTAVQAIQRF